MYVHFGSCGTACLGTRLKRWAAGISLLQPVDEHYSLGGLRARLFGWSAERRFVVVREQVRQDK